jgi:hypothetical protein
MQGGTKFLAVMMIALLCAGSLTGCGKSKEQEAAEAAAAKMAEAAKKLEEMAKAAKSGAPQSPQEAVKQGADAMAAASAMIGAMMGGDAKGAGAVAPVDFRELKALLPESIGGMKRGEESGERNAVAGISVSQAQARYSDGGKSRLRVKITDAGSMSGFAGMAAAAWTMVDIDKETPNGYEKTSTVGGRRMHEQWDNRDKRGEVAMIVGGRFIVEMRGNGIEMKDLKQAINAIDIKKLEALKNAPPAAAAK